MSIKVRHELGGALADLGVMIPLAFSLIALNGLNPTAVFLGVGLTYIAAGWFYRLPIPVQPLKAMSALAIAQGLPSEVIAAGGLWIGAALLLLALTGTISWLNRLFPRSIIRGIQLTVGLLLLKTGLELALRPRFALGGGASLAPGLVVAAVTLVIITLFLWRPLAPAALVVTAGGLLAGWVAGVWPSQGVAWGPVAVRFALPSPDQWWAALILLAIPQLPLTLGNAVLATADVAREYFPSGASRVTPRALALSGGLGNLLAGSIGGLPVCHGSGGLTAHYRFGARRGLANFFIGGLFLALATIFGRAALALIGLMPLGVLAAMLAYVGGQHIQLVTKLSTRFEWSIAILVALISLAAGGNIAVGALVGLLVFGAGRLIARTWAPGVAMEGDSDAA